MSSGGYDTPFHRSRWEPTDFDFAGQPSGKALVNDETGEVIALSNGQFYGLLTDTAEDAAVMAEEALRRIEGRDRTLDLSNPAEPEHQHEDDEDALLARWDAEQ